MPREWLRVIAVFIAVVHLCVAEPNHERVFLQFESATAGIRLKTIGYPAEFSGNTPSSYELEHGLLSPVSVVVADPPHACGGPSALRNADEMSGKVVLVVRGNNCTFVDKVRAVTASTAAAVVIVNSDDSLFTMSNPANEHFTYVKRLGREGVRNDDSLVSFRTTHPTSLSLSLPLLYKHSITEQSDGSGRPHSPARRAASRGRVAAALHLHVDWRRESRGRSDAFAACRDQGDGCAVRL